MVCKFKRCHVYIKLLLDYLAQKLGKAFGRSLYSISKRSHAEGARASVLPTGKANQALVQAMTAEGLMSKRVFQIQIIGGRRIVQVRDCWSGGAVVAGQQWALWAALLLGECF
jgi:hypothetical protein